MPSITISVDCAAPPERVWASLSDIASHYRWMEDALGIEFLSDQHQGVGTRFRCPTKIGPLRTEDIMEVTQWDEGRAIGVHHRGAVSGSGVFSLAPSPTGTQVTWTESLSLPWYFGGPAGGIVAKPILRHIWKRNLKNLRELVERAPASPV